MVIVTENVIDVTIKKSDGEEKLQVVYRYPTKAEEKDIERLGEQIREMSRELTSIQQDIEDTEKKIEYAEKLGEYKKAEKLLNEKRKLQRRLEEVVEAIDKNGGGDILEVVSKKFFDMLVGGRDKEKLREIAESVGYAVVIAKLNEARKEQEGKRR